MTFEQVFYNAEELSVLHNRFRTGALIFLAVCALLPALGTGAFAWSSLSDNMEIRAMCDGKAYPWDWAPGQVPPYASHEACVEARPLLRGDAKDFGPIAGGLFPLSLLFVALAVGLRKRMPPALRVLRDRPQDVVWAHALTISGGGADRYAMIYTAQHEGYELQTDTRDRATDVVRRVGELCPTATIGFTKELQEAYNKDPKSLRRTGR
jgi:hypothetical protein